MAAMTVGELRARLADLPDYRPVTIEVTPNWHELEEPDIPEVTEDATSVTDVGYAVVIS